MLQKLLQEIKRAFWALCGAISPEELTTNESLIQSITRVEKAFSHLV